MLHLNHSDKSHIRSKVKWDKNHKSKSMKQKIKPLILTGLALALSSYSVFGQDQPIQTTSHEINGQTFKKVDGIWKVLDKTTNTYFQINQQVISVKFSDEISDTQMANFINAKA